MKTGLGKAIELPHLFGAEMHENPYPVYQRLRETDPVHWDDTLKAWVLTRHDDVAWALKSLSSDRVSLARERFRGAGFDALWDALAALMLQRDEPDHTRLRALVQKAFFRTSVEQWTAPIERRIRSLLAPGLARGQMDFVWDFAVPLPHPHHLGAGRRPRGRPRARQALVRRLLDRRPQLLRQHLVRAARARAPERDRVSDVSRGAGRRVPPRAPRGSAQRPRPGRARRPSTDRRRAPGQYDSPAERGDETTSSLLGNGLVALLGHPEQRERLRREPASIPSAVEECLRYDSPVQFLGRMATADVECAGTPIRQGQLVLAVLAAANRDPAHFPDPDRFDVARHPNFHLAFGHGHHHCVGAELARLEARMAFTILLTELGTLELLPTDLRHRENFNMRCYQTLPIRLSTWGAPGAPQAPPRSAPAQP